MTAKHLYGRDLRMHVWPDCLPPRALFSLRLRSDDLPIRIHDTIPTVQSAGGTFDTFDTSTDRDTYAVTVSRYR